MLPAVFHKQQPPGFKGGEGFPGYGLKVFESLGFRVGAWRGPMMMVAGDFVRVHEARYERRDRLEIPDFRREALILPLSHIRRVADEQVQRSRAEEGPGEIGTDGQEPLPYLVACGILAGGGKDQP